MVSTYKIHYAIEGVAEFTCDSKEEAEAMFDRLSKRELAEEGLLERDDALTDAELEAQAREFQIARSQLRSVSGGRQ